MPSAISRSPMMTSLAPSAARCSTSASEWARATIWRLGLAARACSTTWPASKAVGDGDDQRDARRRDWRPRESAGFAALPTIDLDAGLAEPGDGLVGVLDDEERLRAVLQRLAHEAADAAVADRTVWPVRALSAASFLRPRRGRSGVARAGRALGRSQRARHARSRRGVSQSISANTSGLTMIERMAPARIRSRPCSGRRPRSTPSAARMKENSPICARLAEMVKALATGWRNAMHDQEGGDRLARSR